LPHLILYDGVCGLCDLSVKLLIKIDRKEQLLFSSLQGVTAEKLSSRYPFIKAMNSVVLIENFQTAQEKAYTKASAPLRAFWLIGGGWKIIGALFFLPPFLFNWLYVLVSKYRYFLFSQRCLLPQKNENHRFLP